MNYKINNTYNGFKMIKQYPISEINSLAQLFIHEKSGARLLNLENDDDNKVFSISFRTPPNDHTGVPHIVEHCVLSGSRKYKTKEPFMDMLKGSLNTFINAMTFDDKTLYPIATRNEKDFYNLMDLYLDSVFYPGIYDMPEIFMQEGWHYELNSKDEPITYKGVVYNEMRGAYSSPNTILNQAINESLFPNTCYQYASGGDPDEIPKLTYDDFKAFHKKFYHPSNSYIYLYGNGNIDDQLKFIDENYLCDFEKTDIDSSIALQQPFTSMLDYQTFYPIAETDESINKDYLSFNFVLGHSTDTEIYVMGSLLQLLLVDSSAAPIKKALIDAGIGEDILCFENEGIQTHLSITAKNTDIGKKELFKQIIFDSLKKLVSDGIDKKLIESCINIVEYNLRESSGFPTKGIIYNILALDSWLYEDYPTRHIEYEPVLKKLRSQINTNYFENFINEHILNNNHCSLVVMQPSKTLNSEKANRQSSDLTAYKENLDEKEIENLIATNQVLKEKQLSPDSAEALATIPKLALSDIDKIVKPIVQRIDQKNEATLLFHDIFTNGISYTDLIFNTSMINKDLIPYINLLSHLLGKVDTKTYAYSDLSNEIYLNSGGINFSTHIYKDTDHYEIYSPKFTISSKSIGEKNIKVLSLIDELISNSKFEDSKRIKELFQQLKSRLEMSIFQNGHAVASRRVASYYSNASKYSETLSGLDFFWFLSDLIANFDENKDVILNNIKTVYEQIFNINDLIISFTGEQKDYTLFENHLDPLLSNLNKNKFESQTYVFGNRNENEGIQSSANVQYVAKGFNFKELSYDYTGSMRVLSNMLNTEFLHNRVRAKGGAYGCSLAFDRSGNLSISSYRDPNITETLGVYDEISEHIANLDLDQETLTKFIIGAISKTDPATTPHMDGQIATRNYICNITQEKRQEERNAILETTLEDFKKLGLIIDASMKKNYLCVLGNDVKIKENAEHFKHLVDLNRQAQG